MPILLYLFVLRLRPEARLIHLLSLALIVRLHLMLMYDLFLQFLAHMVSVLLYFVLFQLAVSAGHLIQLNLSFLCFKDKVFMLFKLLIVSVEGCFHDSLNPRIIIIYDHFVPVIMLSMVVQCLQRWTGLDTWCVISTLYLHGLQKVHHLYPAFLFTLPCSAKGIGRHTQRADVERSE